MKRTFALITLLVTVLGCAKKTENTSAPVGADSVQFVTRTLHYETADCRTRGEPCLQFDMAYPELLAVPGGDTLALNRELRRRLNAGSATDTLPLFAPPDSVLSARIAAFEKPLPNEAPWFDSTYAKVERFVPGALTISIFQFWYGGGAHPNTTRIYAVLDPSTAHEVPLDSVLVKGSREKLLAAVERAFRKVRGMSADSSLTAAGFWFKGPFELTPNWGFGPDGMVFHYNSYEVAPYAMGPTPAVVPYADLQGIVRSRYLP